MIKPTIGRVVWYWPSMAHGALRGADEQPLAAMVCHVWSDDCVNLVVFDLNGIPQSQTSVFLYQGETDRPSVGFAEWMPYQIGQAKKHKD